MKDVGEIHLEGRELEASALEPLQPPQKLNEHRETCTWSDKAMPLFCSFNNLYCFMHTESQIVEATTCVEMLLKRHDFLNKVYTGPKNHSVRILAFLTNI